MSPTFGWAKGAFSVIPAKGAYALKCDAPLSAGIGYVFLISFMYVDTAFYN